MVLTALILAGPWLHHDKVICIQSESHVQVERVGADCCRQEAIEVASGSITVSESDQDCGSCQDVPFAQDATRIAQCVSAARSIYSTNGLTLDGHLPISIGIGDQISREKIPLYPLAGNPFSSIHLSTVFRC